MGLIFESGLLMSAILFTFFYRICANFLLIINADNGAECAALIERTRYIERTVTNLNSKSIDCDESISLLSMFIAP